MKLAFAWILIQFFLLRESYSQCSGTTKVLHPGSGHIQSPNFPNELGKVANCTWKFLSDGKKYALILNVTRLRLYFLVGGTKKCSGSNILKMERDVVECKKYVELPNAATFCNAYYSSDTCDTTKQGCEINQSTSFPLQVTYESDGRIVEGNSGPVQGFKIEYKYIQCPPKPTTSSKTHTTKEPITAQATNGMQKETTTTSETHTEKEPITAQATNGMLEENTTDMKSTAGIHESEGNLSEEPVSTQTTGWFESGNTDAILSQNEIIIIASAGGGGLVLLSLLTTVICCCCNRKRKLPIANEPMPTEVDNVYVPMSPILPYPIEVDQPQSTDLETADLLDVPDYSTIDDLKNSKNNINRTNTRDEDTNLASIELEADVNENNENQSDALYSAIQTDNRGKVTVKYNKTTIQNVLYVPAEQDKLNIVEESVYDISNDQ